MALRAEFWLYAVRNPEAMGALRLQQRQQADALIGVISATMERWNTLQASRPQRWRQSCWPCSRA